MKGKQKGRPTKWVTATVQEDVDVCKRGVTFEIWEKWKKKRKKLGRLTVSVGGLRWRPRNSPKYRQQSWEKIALWFGD